MHSSKKLFLAKQNNTKNVAVLHGKIFKGFIYVKSKLLNKYLRPVALYCEQQRQKMVRFRATETSESVLVKVAKVLVSNISPILL